MICPPRSTIHYKKLQQSNESFTQLSDRQLWPTCQNIAAYHGGGFHLKCDGTRWRKGGELKRKLANEVGSQYTSHYLRTWCIQHYYRCMRTPRLAPVDWTDVPGRFKWTGSFRAKDEIWFLSVCHHISTGLYRPTLFEILRNFCR